MASSLSRARFRLTASIAGNRVFSAAFEPSLHIPADGQVDGAHQKEGERSFLESPPPPVTAYNSYQKTSRTGACKPIREERMAPESKLGEIIAPVPKVREATTPSHCPYPHPDPETQ